LTTAVSGTVGVGNVVHVAVAISIGGPGATFWLIVAGFLGMASKFVECTLGVKYRQTNPDGSISGGPMFYMDKGFAELNMPRLGKVMAWYYALCVMLASLGAGCMFQANQAYVQVLSVSGGESSFFAGRGWLFGTLLAIVTAMVIVGGIKSIARVTSKLVPFMALLYMSFALIVIGANYEKLPGAIISIFTNAFSPEGVTGGAIAVLVLGFRRAAFSNEAGIGSSAIAHAAVKTKEPLTQGFVAMLEPFIDTVVVCTITALVIMVTVYDPAMLNDGVISGVELTSAAFASVMPWFPYVLAVVIMLFAYSTMISWSYYGLEGFVYMFGASRTSKLIFNTTFCLFVVIGCTTQLTAVLDFSDAMIFAMALANILALYVLGPGVKRDLEVYWQQRAN
jgi:AGCS family alanine or glycine:cation symporter